jgi:hypothetical protein
VLVWLFGLQIGRVRRHRDANLRGAVFEIEAPVQYVFQRLNRAEELIQ